MTIAPDGVITHRDIKAFTCGSCYQLAIATAEATGWPVCAFWNKSALDFDLHAFVKTPCGAFLDIQGVHTRREMFREWCPDDAELFGIHRVKNPRKALRSWDCGNPYIDYDARAVELVPHLVDIYQSHRLWVERYGR